MAHRYLLVLRFALVNIVAAALLAAIYMQGWIDGLNDRLTLTLSGIVFAVFFYGLVLCGAKVWRTSLDLNDIHAEKIDPDSRAARYVQQVKSKRGENRSIAIANLRLNFSHSIGIIRQIANSLVFLGLIGTVIGFIIALSGVDPEATARADNVATMVATLIRGMSVALYTTLVGAVLNVWLTVNHRILATGTVNLLSAITQSGERRGTV